ncbi:MAG: ABC transporter permease [Kofleriaceae bacterium]|nr:MAG: ABC transporter permease [Kofleriaceae bacterium]MBZ0232457.1 ABC transporter permease [Kofleriaceae bacterium]
MIPRRKRAGLPDWVVIARRELLERIRTPWFIVVTLLGPVLMIALVVVPVVLGRVGDQTARVEILDRSGKLGEPLRAALVAEKWRAEVVSADTDEQALRERIRTDRIDGYLVVSAEAPAGGTFVYRGDNASAEHVMRSLNRVVYGVVLAARGKELAIADDKVARLLAPVAFTTRHSTGEAGEEETSGLAAFLVGYVVMFVLYLAIVLYAVNVLRSVVQEKTNRVVEIMVAAAKPRALMLGKILGVGAVGLVQVTVWAVMGLVTINQRGALLGMFGVDAGGWNVPPMDGADIAVILVYFLLGYFFYAAIFAAIGAMVSSEQEAQQAQTPVMMVLIIPMLCVQLVANDPRGGVAEFLTQLPFSSAVLMPMRWSLGGASPVSLVVSIAILALSTYLVALLAARIYRVGILMYGKRPTLRELVRWLRY